MTRKEKRAQISINNQRHSSQVQKSQTPKYEIKAKCHERI